MNITIFYDSSEVQSIAGAAILKNYFDNDTVTVKDTTGANEAAITAQIGTISAASQHRCYILVGVAAGHVAGNFTDAQVLLLDAKLYGSSTDPASDDASRQLGETSGDDLPSWLVWENTYSGIHPPEAIYYIGRIDATDPGVPAAAAFALYSGTASAGASTTMTDASQSWTVDALIGKYVYVYSGTGINQYATITDNDATSVTFSAWSKDAGTASNTDGTSVYRVVKQSDRVLADLRLTNAITTYYSDITDSEVMSTWALLVNPNDNIKTSGVSSVASDPTTLADVLLEGKHFTDFDNK